MVSVFMISLLNVRSCASRAGLAFGTATVLLLAGACQKVPLLAPTGSSIVLSAAATTLPVNGSTDLIAQVLESGGTPPQDGTLVTFTTTLGTIQPSAAETSGGRVTVRFLAGTTSGTANIIASSGGATITADKAVKILIGGAAVDSVQLSASAATLPPSGGTVTLTAFALDVSGNLLPGVPISFSTTAGQLSASIVNSDQNGFATVTLQTTRRADVIAFVGAKGAKVSIELTTGPGITLSAPSPASPTVGQTVTFTITLAVPGANGAAVRSVIMDFGDGSPTLSTGIAASTPVTHVYNSPNTYTAKATATDVNGEQSTAVSTVTVNAPGKPTVRVSVTKQQDPPGSVFTVTVDATPSVTGLTIQDLFINFGDGQTVDLGAQASAVVPHVYQTAATYKITATARDSGGGVGEASTLLIVGSGSTVMTAAFTFSPSAPKVGTQVSFNASDSVSPNPIVAYDWDFGDTGGTSTNGPSVNHPYSAAFTYTVRLTIRDSTGREATTSKTVPVSP